MGMWPIKPEPLHIVQSGHAFRATSVQKHAAVSNPGSDCHSAQLGTVMGIGLLNHVIGLHVVVGKERSMSSSNALSSLMMAPGLIGWLRPLPPDPKGRSGERPQLDGGGSVHLPYRGLYRGRASGRGRLL